jgi:hypothetical protein
MKVHTLQVILILNRSVPKIDQVQAVSKHAPVTFELDLSGNSFYCVAFISRYV